MNLLISLRSELLKTRRTASFYLTLIGAAVGPVIFLLNVLLDDDEMDGTKKDPLNSLFKILSEMNGVAFFPWFIILICTLLPQIEYRNNTWKQVFASPQTKANVFIAKFLNIHLLMLLFLIATHLFMFLNIVGVNFIKPDLNLFKHSLNGSTVLLNAANAYVTMFAIGTIHFWLGIRFKNFIVPIAVGLALWLTGTLLVFQFNSTIAYYFPYSYPAISLSPKYKLHLEQVAWTSVGYAVVVLLLTYFDLRRRRMNN
jgi:lantibiotic transport system permease protein